MSELNNSEDENDTNHERSLIPANLFDDDDIMDNLNNDNLERILAVSSSSTSSSSLGLLNNDIMDTLLNANSLIEPQSPHDENIFNIPDISPGVSSVYLEYRNNIINDLLNRGRISLGSSRIINTDSQRERNNILCENGGGDFQIGGIPVSWTFDVEIDNSSNWGHRLHELRNVQIFNSLTPASIENAISNGILNRFSNEHWSHYLNVLRDYVFNASPPRWERINAENNYVDNENHTIEQQQPSAILEQHTNGFNSSATTASNWPLTWNPASMFDGFDELIQIENFENVDSLSHPELLQISVNNEIGDSIQSMVYNVHVNEQAELEEIDDDINTVIRQLLLLNLNLWLDRQCSP